MKQLDDKATLELELPLKRGRGRPPSNGVTMTAAERQKAYMERKREDGLKPLTVLVSDDLFQALEKYVEFKDMTKSEAIERIVHDRLLRKR